MSSYSNIYQSKDDNVSLEYLGHKLDVAQKEEYFTGNYFNLFSKNIFERLTIFNGSKQSSLNDFWSYYLIERECDFDGLLECVKCVYEIARNEKKSIIAVEESEKDLFITIKSSEIFDSITVSRKIKEMAFFGEYLYKKERLSFKIPKTKSSKIAKKSIQAPKIYRPKTPSSNVHKSFDSYSLTDLHEHINIINSTILRFRFGTEIEDIVELSEEIAKVSSVLMPYTEIYDIAVSLKHLSTELHENKVTVINKTSSIYSLLVAFGEDFERWVNEVLVAGKPSVNHFTETVTSNIQIICGFIKPVALSTDMDDIFNF